VPLLAAALIVLAVPSKAREFYQEKMSTMDMLILGLGGCIFVVQLVLCWRALLWRGTSFNQRPDKMLSNLAQAAEWFPLLGLIGTVAGILVTFSTIGGQSEVAGARVGARDIIRAYAPAITATGSGLFMSLINIMPSWVVLLGRDLILGLGGGSPAPREVKP
jgi:hypothetical protein